MIFLTIVTTVTAVTTVLLSLKKSLAQYFLKDQFDTSDNRCDVLRAAFCDSGYVFCGEVACLVLVDRLHDFIC